MKTLLALFAFTVMLCACHKRKDIPSTKVVVIADQTDSFQLQPLPQPILSLYDFAHAPEQEAAFDAAIITDRLLNPVYHCHLADGPTTEERNTTDDVHNRDKLIQGFQSKVTEILNSGMERFQPGSEVHHSEVWCTVMHQLKLLAASRYKQKILLVYSDLDENSVFNSYSAEAQKQLQDDPEALIRSLSEQCDMPSSLKGVRILFLYRPPTRAADKRYQRWMEAYQLALGNLGADIHYQASNDHYDLGNE